MLILCPQCESSTTWRDGNRNTTRGTVQRYSCRICGYRFSETNIQVDVTRQVVKRPHPMYDLPHYVVANQNLSLKKSLNNFTFFGREDIGPHDPRIVEQKLNRYRDYNSPLFPHDDPH